MAEDQQLDDVKELDGTWHFQRHVGKSFLADLSAVRASPGYSKQTFVQITIFRRKHWRTGHGGWARWAELVSDDNV